MSPTILSAKYFSGKMLTNTILSFGFCFSVKHPESNMKGNIDNSKSFLIALFFLAEPDHSRVFPMDDTLKYASLPGKYLLSAHGSSKPPPHIPNNWVYDDMKQMSLGRSRICKNKPVSTGV
jgi:hypothetical protein